MNRRRPPTMHNGAGLVEAVADRFGLRGLTGRHRLFPLWEQIVGRRYAEVCRPYELKGGTLIVRVVDSVWGQDIRLHAPLILDKIAELTGDAGVKKLRVVTGPIEPLPRQAAPPPLDTVDVDTDDIDAYLDASAAKDKPELRRLLARAWANSRRLAKRRRETPR
jgi:hypothetical protein